MFVAHGDNFISFIAHQQMNHEVDNLKLSILVSYILK